MSCQLVGLPSCGLLVRALDNLASPLTNPGQKFGLIINHLSNAMVELNQQKLSRMLAIGHRTTAQLIEKVLQLARSEHPCNTAVGIAEAENCLAVGRRSKLKRKQSS